MIQLLTKYKRLINQLACPLGEETNQSELIWNELIAMEIDELFEDVPKETINLIKNEF